MTELENMQLAKAYIDDLANGTNPINNIPVADSDVINNIRIFEFYKVRVRISQFRVSFC